MAEDDSTDDSQKTEDPTPRRLEEARKRGQVVYSREVNNWVVLFAATLLAALALPHVMTDIKNTMGNLIEQSYDVPGDPASLMRVLREISLHAAEDMVLPLLLLALAGILSGLLQTGPLFTFEPITPDLSKISLIKGFERLFSARSMVEMLKGVVKLVLVSIAVVIVLKPYFAGIGHFIGVSLPQAMVELKMLFIKMMVAVLSVLFFLAIIDYLFQRHEFMQNMRMSKQDIKEEFRQTEGDPHVKGRLRQLREQRARQRMMQAVPKADVVITNPTHYAVALKYDTAETDAPVMVAKGVDLVAQRIKQTAKENDVPIIENPTLARALYDTMQIDQMIPQDQYKAVAEVISYVFKLKGKKL